MNIDPCRFISGSAKVTPKGRRVYPQDVYDSRSLLLKSKIIKLQAAFGDLPQILARKGLVKPLFKEFVASLGYDLQVYKNLFDDFDKKLVAEPEDIQALVQQALLETEGRNFRQFFHSKVQELDCIVADFSREEHHLHGAYFRNQLLNFILCCPLMARTNIKPRGYAGDSKMMQMIYLNDYQGNSTFSKLMQIYTVGTPAAQSVRNRQTVILDLLHKLRDRLNLPPQEKIKILSVACGPAWEIKKILIDESDFEKYHFTLLDQDRLALNEAHQVIDEIERKSGVNAHVDYVQASARTMIANKIFKGDLGKFDFIYSMGLFDYLSTPVAMRVLDRLYQLLSPRGELVAGNFHVSNSSRNFMEYWGDWYLIHRTGDELVSLIKDANTAEFSKIFEASRNQLFLKVNKKLEN